MLELDFKNNKLIVSLDPSHIDYMKVFKIVRSLLTSQEVGNNIWRIGYDDLVIMKERLDKAGLINDRSITDPAIGFVNKIQSINVRNDNLKSGKDNERIKKLLEGKIKSTLYEDQLDAVSYSYSNRRCGIFFPMGVGKSLVSLASISIDSNVRKSLVICPKSVMIGFEEEVKKHTYLRSISLPTGRKNAVEYLRKVKDDDWNVCIVNPENLIGSKKSQVYGELTSLIKELPWGAVIVDEYHQYKNMNAKRTKCVISILNETRDQFDRYPRVLLMTGTPVSESPLNAYAVLKVIGYERLPHISRFENYFTIKQEQTYGKKGTFKKIVGYKNLGELKKRLSRVSIHRSKDGLKGFPDKTEMVKYLELTGDQKKIYKALCGELKENLPMDKQITLNEFLQNPMAVRLRQALNSPELLDTKSNSVKYDAIDDILEELFEDPKEKVIIWTEFRKAVDILYERYNKKYGAVKVYGGEDMAKVKKSFEALDGPRVAICIPAKAGTGVDFLARARTAIYVDRPYSYILYKQSLDRIHRRTKSGDNLTELEKIRTQPATIIFLDVSNTIDEVVSEKLHSKDAVATAVTTSDETLIKIGRSDLLKILK
jgi:SNF2 family DNA or RNA helicase